jgi:hypothetical protein
MVVGAGTIGLLTLQIVRALVPDAEISVLAKHSFQVEQATRLGAKHLIYPRNRYRGVIQATNAQPFHRLGNQMMLGGYDVIYDTIGRSQTIHDALRWARPRATVVLVGIDLHMHNVDLSPVWYQEVNLYGTYSHGTEHWPVGSLQQRDSFTVAHELISTGKVTPEKLITHRYAITDYRTALRTAIKKGSSNALKVIFDHSLVAPSVVPQQSAVLRQNAPTRTPAIPAPTITSPALTSISTSAFPPAVVGKKDSAPIPVASIPPTPVLPAKPVVHIIAAETPSAIPEADVAALPAVPFDKTLLASEPNPDRLSAIREEEEAEEDTATSIPAVRTPRMASPLSASLPSTPQPQSPSQPAVEEKKEVAVQTEKGASKTAVEEDEYPTPVQHSPAPRIEDFPTAVIQQSPSEKVEDLPTIIQPLKAEKIEDLPTTIIQQSPADKADEYATVIEQVPDQVEDYATTIMQTSDMEPVPYWLDQKSEEAPEWLQQLDPQNMPNLNESKAAEEPVANKEPEVVEKPQLSSHSGKLGKKKRNR